MLEWAGEECFNLIMSYIGVLLFHHKGFVSFLSLSYTLTGDLVFLKKTLISLERVNLEVNCVQIHQEDSGEHTHKRDAFPGQKYLLLTTEVYQKLEEKQS